MSTYYCRHLLVNYRCSDIKEGSFLSSDQLCGTVRGTERNSSFNRNDAEILSNFPLGFAMFLSPSKIASLQANLRLARMALNFRLAEPEQLHIREARDADPTGRRLPSRIA